MGIFDDIIGSATSIWGSAAAVDGSLRTQLGPVYGQISALLGQVGSADGIMRQSDMQNLFRTLQALPQPRAGSAGDPTAKQAKILMMIVQINALKVQLQNLEEDLEEMKRDATDPALGEAHKVRRDIGSLQSGSLDR